MSHPQSHLPLQPLSWRPVSGLLRHRREEVPAGPARTPLISAHRHTLPPGRSARVWGAKACGGHLWPGATAWVASRLLPFISVPLQTALRLLSWDRSQAPGRTERRAPLRVDIWLPRPPPASPPVRFPPSGLHFCPPGITHTPKLYACRLLSQAVLQGDPAWGVATAF